MVCLIVIGGTAAVTDWLMSLITGTLVITEGKDPSFDGPTTVLLSVTTVVSFFILRRVWRLYLWVMDLSKWV